MGAAGALVGGATAFRLDVYSDEVHCNGSTVAAGAGPPTASHTYKKGEPITLPITPGLHALVLTAYADSQATMPLGQGCVVASASPGAELCFDLTLAPVADLGLTSSIADMAGGDMPTTADLAAASTLTERFESGAIGAPWRQIVDNGALTVDSAHAHSGLYALHVHQNSIAAPGSAQLQIAETAVVPLPDIYIRAFVWIPAGADPTTVAIIAVDQPVTPYHGLNLNIVGSPPTFAMYDNVAPAPISSTSTTIFPTSQWTCVEWHIQVGTSGFAKVYVNNAEITSLSGVQNTQATPSLGSIAVGLLAPAQNAGARDVWFDDIIVDSNPIGCAK